MTLRHRPRSARGTLSRFAVGAAASLAVVASTGVAAGAVEDATIDDPDATSQTPTEETEPTGPALETPAEDEGTPLLEDPLAEDPATLTPAAPGATAPQAAELAPATAAAPVVPNFGSQKVRVGVQLADGAYVPEGTTLAGSTLQITISGGVDEEGEPSPSTTETCTTFGGGTTSTCDGENPDGSYDLSAGRTMTVQHLSSPAGIVVNPTPIVIGPCDFNEVESCSGTRDALVTVTGTLPTATPDAASTSFGTPIVIDVLANDDPGNGAPITGLSIAEQPANGTAEVIGEFPPVTEPDPELPELPELELAGAPDVAAAQVAAAPVAAAPSPVQVLYTPNAGFAGTDTFVYAVTTPNGTVTGTVTVQVLAAAVPSAPNGVTPIRTGVLPSVGGSDATLVGLGALLVTAGAATLAAGRRREEVRGLLG